MREASITIRHIARLAGKYESLGRRIEKTCAAYRSGSLTGWRDGVGSGGAHGAAEAAGFYEGDLYFEAFVDGHISGQTRNELAY